MKCATDYRVEPKTKEDSDYADRVLVSDCSSPTRMNIQIRHLDADIIAEAGRHRAFDGNRTPAQIVAHIRDAINDKAQVDPGIKTATILQLTAPAPLGIEIKQTIDGNVFDHKGFRDVWTSRFHEDSFPLHAL